MAKDSIELALSVLQAEKANLSPKQRQQLVELADTGEDVRSDVTDTLEATEKRELTPEQQAELLSALEVRLTRKQHYQQVKGVNFAEVKAALEANPELMNSLAQMEQTGGAPNVIAVEDDAFIFGDCSAESPNRRNITYDQATEMAKKFGVDMMSEDVYRKMQETGEFDISTWSWLATPADIKEAGHALVGGRDDAVVDVYQNNAHHHNAYKGWRGVLRVPKA